MGRFHEPGQGNPKKVVNPQLASKGAGLGFTTFPLFWGQQSDRLPFFDGLDLPSTMAPQIRAMPRLSSFLRPSFMTSWLPI